MNPFGPLLPNEMVRGVRRQRLTTIRCVYALGIAAFAGTVYAIATENWTTRTKPQQLAPITEGLFYGLLGLQFLVACGVSTNWMADAIAQEKERRTLPFLLATPLTDREIVVGKLVARLAQVLMLLLAGLPVMCALQFFGGIEPLAVLLGYAATGATVLSLGSLSLLCSIYSRTTRAVKRRAARVVSLYIFGMMALSQMFRHWPPPLYVHHAFDRINSGNPFALVFHLIQTVSGGGRFDDVLWADSRDYMLFHLLAAAVFVTWAAWKLRSVAAHHAEGLPPRKQTGLFRPPPRPPVGNRPVLWRTIYFDFRQIQSVGGRKLAQLVFVLSFVPVTLMLAIFGFSGLRSELPETMNQVFVRGLGTLVLCGLCVMIAANSSGCFVIERRKRTFEDLLLSDLSAEEILGQKWWASIVVVRWALVWVGAHWLIAVVTGGLQPLAVPLLALEWAVYAAFAASLGIYFAARLPRARAAGVGAGLLAFLGVSLPLCVAGLVAVVAEKLHGDPSWAILPASLSPPVVMGLSGFYGVELDLIRQKHPAGLAQIIAGGTTSLAVAVVFAWMFWRGACRRFQRAID